MPIHDEINTAIARHGQWKARLKSAIDAGKFVGDIGSLGQDNQCDFGKWLYSGVEQRYKESADYASVKELHAAFHKTAAKVLQLVNAGRKAEAEKTLELGGEFFVQSSKLVSALMKWDKSVV